jgi:ABC-type sugar transport system substrate-binding protein
MSRRIPFIGLLLVVALVAAACGDDGPGGEGPGGEFGPGIDGADEFGERYDADPALVAQALGPVGDIPDIVAASIYRAGLEVDDDTLAIALTCFNNQECDTGTGGPLTMGVADGGRGNAWREVTHMEAILQALTYPEIGKIISMDAQWDPDFTVAEGHIRFLIQSGVDFIIGYPDQGSALASVVLEAEAAGIPYIPYSAGWIGLSGQTGALTPGQDYLTIVGEDLCKLGESYAGVLNEHASDGTISVLGGTTGNALSAGWQRCLQPSLDARFTVDGPEDTFWFDPVVLQVVQGMLARNDDITGFAYEYAHGLAYAFQAYDELGIDVEDLVLAVRTDEPTLFCDWVDRGMSYEIWYSAGGNFQSRVAVTAAMMDHNGADIPAEIVIPHVMRQPTADDCDPTRSERMQQVSNTSLVPEHVLEAMYAG